MGRNVTREGVRMKNRGGWDKEKYRERWLKFKKRGGGGGGGGGGGLE